VVAPLRVLGRDPDVVGHVGILGGFVGLRALAARHGHTRRLIDASPGCAKLTAPPDPLNSLRG